MRILGDKLQTFTHWFGWSLAIAASVLFMVYDFREWIILSIHKGFGVSTWFYIALVIAVCGTIFSLYKRVAGGLLMLAGGAGMVLYYYFTTGWLDAGLMIVYGLPFVLPAFLLLIVKK